MRSHSGFAIGVFFGLITSCAAVTFPYKYYGLHSDVGYVGKLLGPTAADDLDLAICSPTLEDMSPCTVMQSAQYLALKQDYLDKVNQLNDCQSQLKN